MGSAIYDDYGADLVGLVPSAMRGMPVEPRPTDVSAAIYGRSVALFETAQPALPRHPTLHLPLSHPGLTDVLADIATRYGYDIV